MGVAIVGCGGIGHKRMAALDPSEVVVVCDLDAQAARSMAERLPSCRATGDPHSAVRDPKVSWVIVATTNDALASVTAAALQAGKHVLVEKPAGISTAQLERLQRLQASSRAVVRVGFNHRYHRAIAKARAIVDSGELGPLMFLRGRYGHGGRVGYDREWRADPARSGGGELIDQGVHLIDLATWFLGNWTSVQGHAATYFWDMPVDDNAFISLRNARGQTAWLHVSCTEWKNTFSLEIYGRNGKLQIDGLGGSYGVERLTHYKMLPEMGPPDTSIDEFPSADRSWSEEIAAFRQDMARPAAPSPGLPEALACMQVVETIYEMPQRGGKAGR